MNTLQKNMKVGEGRGRDKLAALESDSRCLHVSFAYCNVEVGPRCVCMWGGVCVCVINITMRCIIINIIHNDLDVL